MQIRSCLSGTAVMLMLSALVFPVQADVKQCVGCHGLDGGSEQPGVPVIGGVSAYYLEYALTVYRQDGRSCPRHAGPDGAELSMCDIARGLSKAQITATAAHYAEQRFRAPEQSTEPAKVAAGAQLHQRLCAKCHTDNGARADDDAGILAGQWRAYLQFTMEDFRAGRRQGPKPMDDKLKALRPSDVEALAHFYAAQP